MPPRVVDHCLEGDLIVHSVLAMDKRFVLESANFKSSNEIQNINHKKIILTLLI